MQMATPPSFFKVLIDASTPHLPLPPDFVTGHLKNNIPENPTLRSATGGHSWRLKIKEIDGNYCFAHGWSNVVEDAQLGFGDFLVFCLVDESDFKVTIFGRNGCEKNLPSKIRVEEEEDIDGNSVVDVVDDDGVDVVVDDDGVDGVDDDGVDVNDDDDVDDDDGDDDDPCFRTFLTNTHKYMFRLPVKFVGLTGIDTKRDILLKNLDGNPSRMIVRSEKYGRKRRYYLASGWRDFWRRNKLCVGDLCLFKFIGREGNLSLEQVTKNKLAAKESETEEVKRERVRPRLEQCHLVDVESDDGCVKKPTVVYF